MLFLLSLKGEKVFSSKNCFVTYKINIVIINNNISTSLLINGNLEKVLNIYENSTMAVQITFQCKSIIKNKAHNP